MPRYLPGDLIKMVSRKSWYRNDHGDRFGSMLEAGDVVMVICDEGGSSDVLAVGNNTVGWLLRCGRLKRVDE